MPELDFSKQGELVELPDFSAYGELVPDFSGQGELVADSPDPASVPHLVAGKKRGVLGRLARGARGLLDPVIGPSERVKMEESVLLKEPDGTIRPEFKPLGDVVQREGMLGVHGHVAERIERAAPEASAAEKVGRGVARGAVGAIDALFNPLLLMLGPFAQAPLAHRAISGAFGVHMLSQLPDLIGLLNKSVEAKDWETTAEALTATGLMGYFGYRGLKEAAKPGLAQESPKLRAALTKRVTEEYTPQQVREMYMRVNRGEGTPAEAEMVRYLNRELESPGEAVRKGVKFETTEPRIQNEKLRNWLGLDEATARTLIFPSRAATAREPIETPPPPPPVTPTEGETNVRQQRSAEMDAREQAGVSGRVGPEVQVPQAPPGTVAPQTQVEPVGAGQAVVQGTPPAGGTPAATMSDEQARLMRQAQALGAIPTPPAPPTPELKPVVEAGPDFIDLLAEQGLLIRGKKSAKAGSEAYYGELYEAAKSHASVRRVLSNVKGQSPDEVADALRRSGAVSESFSVDDLWESLSKAAEARKGRSGVATREAEVLNREIKQTEDFSKAALEKRKGAEPIPVSNLIPGDTFELQGTQVRVKDLEVEGDNVVAVVLEDGTKFGTQRVGEKQVLNTDPGSYKPAAREAGFEPEGRISPMLAPVEGLMADVPMALLERREKLIEKARSEMSSPLEMMAVETAVARLDGRWSLAATSEAIRHASHGLGAIQYLQKVAGSDDPTQKDVIARANQILKALPEDRGTQAVAERERDIRYDDVLSEPMEVKAEVVLKAIQARTKNEWHKKLAGILLSKKIRPRFTVYRKRAEGLAAEKSIPKNWRGFYTEDTDTVVILGLDQFRADAPQEIETLILHEVMHAATTEAAETTKIDVLYTWTEEKFENEPFHYGLHNTHEFLSEAFTEPKFRKVLDGIPDPANPKQTLLERIINTATPMLAPNPGGKTGISPMVATSPEAAQRKLTEAETRSPQAIVAEAQQMVGQVSFLQRKFLEHLAPHLTAEANQSILQAAFHMVGFDKIGRTFNILQAIVAPEEFQQGMERLAGNPLQKTYAKEVALRWKQAKEEMQVAINMYNDLLEKIQGERWQNRMAKADAVSMEAHLLELAKKYFEDDVAEAIRGAQGIIQKQAFTEGIGHEQMRTLDEKKQYAEAVKATIREIIEVLSSNEEVATFLYGAMMPDAQAIMDRYLALRGEVFPDRALPSDSVIRWSSEIISRNMELAQNLIAMAVLRKNKEVASAYTALERQLAKELRTRPLSAAKRLVKTIGRFATTVEKAQAAFRALNRDIAQMARDLEVAEIAATTAQAVMTDPETVQYEKDIFAPGMVQVRPKEALKQDYDNLKLDEGIILPDGTNTGPIYLVGDKVDFQKSWDTLNQAADKIATWLQDNPGAPEATYWRFLGDYVQNVLLTSRLYAPPKLRTPFRPLGPWGHLVFLADDLGTREGGRLKVSVQNFSRGEELAQNLLHEHFSEMTLKRVDAAKSHGFDKLYGDANAGAIAWYREIGNALASSWQDIEAATVGGKTVGDKINGYTVTKEDMAVIKFMADVAAKGFKIVQEDARRGREGVLAPQYFETSIGDTKIPIHVQSTTVSKYTIPRTYNPESRKFVERYGTASPAQRVELLNANFWNIVARWLADRTHIAYDGASPYEQTYRAISAQIQENGLARQDRNMSWLVQEIARRTGDDAVAVAGQVLKEFDGMVERLNRFFGEEKKDDDITITTLESRSSFTKSRGDKQAGDWLYEHGWLDHSRFVDFFMSVSGYFYTRAAQDLNRVIADLERQQQDLETRMKQLASSTGVTRSGKLQKSAVSEQAAKIQKGETYDDWETIGRKIKYARRTAALFMKVYGPDGTNLDFDLMGLNKLVGVSVGAVLMSELTAIRNLGFGWNYLGKTASQHRGNTTAMYAKAAWNTWVIEFPKYVLSGAYSLSKAGTLGLAKGIGEGFKAAINREGRVIIARFLQPMVQEMSQAMYARIQMQQELVDAGYSRKSYAANDMLAKATLPTTAGAILEKPLFESVLAQLGFGALTILDAHIITPVGRPHFPRAADLNLNEAAFKTAYDMIEVLEEQLRKLFNDYRGAGVNRWDFTDPKNPANFLEPKEALGKWFGMDRTQNNFTSLRQLFEWTGRDYQTAAMEFLAQLEAGNTDAKLLTNAERTALGNELAEETNKASAKNRSLYLKQKEWVWQMVGALMSWNVHRHRSYWKSFSRAGVDPNHGRFILWAAAIMLMILPALIAGGLADVLTEELARPLYKMLRGEERATRQPWEREGTKSQAIGWAISAANAIPFLSTIVNVALNDLPNRKSVDPVLFFQNKAVDVMHYIGGVARSGDMTYGLPQLLKGFLPLSSVFINQVPEVQGSIEALNARRLMRRDGPQDLLKEFGGGSFAAGNVTELTPFGERMLSAAMRGADAEFMATYNQAVEKARALGRAEPEKTVQQMYASRNPYDRAFQRKLTPRQREDFLAKLSPSERAAVMLVEAKYERGAGLIGAPSTFAREPQAQRMTAFAGGGGYRSSRSRLGRRGRIGSRMRRGRRPRLARGRRGRSGRIRRGRGIRRLSRGLRA